MHGTASKRTVIVTSYRIYGEPVMPESGRGPTKAVNGAGEIVEVHRRVGTVELIPDIPADLVSTSGASGMIRTSRDNQGCFRIDDCGKLIRIDDPHD